MKGSALLWKIPLAVVGTVTGVVMMVLVAVACVLYVPSLQSKLLEKGIAIANEKTDWDIEADGLTVGVGDSLSSDYPYAIYLAPLTLYRAWKGQADLPVAVSLDSVFVGHRGQDTLACIRTLRLRAKMLSPDHNSQFTDHNSQVSILERTIVVDTLRLNGVTFHSDSLIPAVGVDAVVGLLAVHSPNLNIAQGTYPLHGLHLHDVNVGIDLRNAAPPDTTARDSVAPLRLAFDVPDGDLRNIRFTLTPVGLDLFTRSIRTNVLVDVGANLYDARRIEIGGTRFAIANFAMPVDTLYGDACVSLSRQLISSNGLHVRSDEFGARADLSATKMDLGQMKVEVTGSADFRGSKAHLKAGYDIDDEAYALHADIEKVDLSSFLKDHKHIVVAGVIDAEGKGINPNSRAMRSKLNVHLHDAVYENICVSGMRLDARLANQTVDGTLHLPFAMTGDSMQVSALTDHRFRVSDFMTIDRIGVDYQTQMRHVQAHVAGEDFRANELDLHFVTGDTTLLTMETEGLAVDVTSPMHVMKVVEHVQQITAYPIPVADLTSLSDLSSLDTMRRMIPDVAANITLSKGSPAQGLIERKGLDLDEINLMLRSDSARTDLVLGASIPTIEHPEDSTALRLPAANAALQVRMTDGTMLASLEADSKLTDGAMMLHGLRTDADLWLDIERTGNELRGAGRVTMDELHFADMDLGSRAVDVTLSPSELYPHALRADVQLDDIPLEIVDSIIKMPDLDLNGAIRAQASIDGLTERFDLSAEVLPMKVSAKYKPYNVQLGLGETPVVMKHNKVDFNGLPVYGADSTYLALTGGLDLNSMRLDIALAADSFIPTKLPKDGPIPVHGELALDIEGNVTGPLDSIVADVEVAILPNTDITYQIDKKNLAQVKPHGRVGVRYATADGSLDLRGRVNVDDGFVRYSPKAYPIMPFHVDSGSHVSFNGPVGQTLLAVSASQKVKADVESEDEETRRVEFTTGVRVNGIVDSIGLNSIDFFLEAPEDETITDELASLDEDTREGLAATLLATGMYVGESNVAAQRSGYALSSIVNSRLNAAMANSKMGKVVEIDLSSAQTEHAGGNTNDLNIAISKSFFHDRFRITVGSTLTDNPEVNQASGLLSNLTAEYKLTKDGDVSLRAFSQRDCNNILEGELYKSGIGVRAKQDWRRKQSFRGDSIMRTYGLMADADVAWRSNNSLGPNLTLTSSIRNVLGKGETFTVKGNGAYYWALRNRHPGDPKKTDTYKLGATASLVFPYLHWGGDDNPEGDTRYMLGYQYENIAGGYGVHKVWGSFTYFIHSSRYITHAFTPFSLSVVRVNAESDSLVDKAAEFPQLIKVLASPEFVPSIGYTFTYNDYRAQRPVNTMLELGFKESGNLINSLYCLFGYKWNDRAKPLGAITFNQFVKMTAELRNKFNITDRVCIATRLYAGANIPLGNSLETPLSEAFYAGGPNGMRAASPYAYGPGNFFSEKFNQNFFHAGDVKLEANFELRFPIVWKLYGATFVDAGNVWNWYSTARLYEEAGITDYVEKLALREDLYDGILDNPYFANQIALGTGAGLRLDLDGLVIRLDLGVAIHAPFLNYKYNKDWKPDKTQPIKTYFNIPSGLDALRVNFGIGYPF